MIKVQLNLIQSKSSQTHIFLVEMLTFEAPPEAEQFKVIKEQDVMSDGRE